MQSKMEEENLEGAVNDLERKEAKKSLPSEPGPGVKDTVLFR